MDEVYWELITHEGDRIEIPPDAVETVKRRWDNKEPIHTKTRGSFTASQIKYFQPTTKRVGQQNLIEAAAQAFNDPMINPDGSIICRWVKKVVTQREYEKHYAAIPSYHFVSSDNGRVTVAFFLPVHQIDPNNLGYCTDEEIKVLTR